uniref:Uncharacterized protein n=1 Tax=Amphimedon queenslandica TaxID=400682 RepID=A0A1X7SP66_AMPQE
MVRSTTSRLRYSRVTEDEDGLEDAAADPRDDCKYNLFCRILFCWLDPLFCIRFKKPSLDHTDLYAHPSECDASYLHNKFMRYWSSRRTENVRLWYVLFKCFWWRIIMIQILALILV